MGAIKEQDTRHIRFCGFPHLNPMNGAKYDRVAVHYLNDCHVLALKQMCSFSIAASASSAVL